MLEINGLNAGYGEMTILRDISISIHKGEVVCIVGGNGAGKTTTLNVISGIIPARSGMITFLGEKINGLPSHKIVAAGVVHVPEGRKVYPRLTVKENLQVGAYLPKARVQKAANLDNVYRMFPILKDRSGQMAGALSGGEQQMLAIGRGLMSQPVLLMLDEPSLGLSPLISKQIFGIIREISQQGTTVLLVEQNVHQALTLCDRAYVLENGAITLSGTGKELLLDDNVKKAYLGM
jgi:branched-chain amino acid transport system ATP-binding protein